MAYNKENGITPETIQKEITSILSSVYEADYVTVPEVSEPAADYKSLDELEKIIRELQDKMKKAAQELAFERAAKLRDQIRDLQALDMELR
jgi:excinuclease ABC subunit B